MLFSILYFPFAPAFAAVTVIENVDLTRQSLKLSETWASGVLRVAIGGVPIDAHQQMTVRYGPAGSLVLGPEEIQKRTIRIRGNERIVDLPIIPGSNVSVVAPKGVSVSALEVDFPESMKREQHIEGSALEFIKKGSTGLVHQYGQAVGRLDVYSAVGTRLKTCTAFRIAKTYWLTAAHCKYRENDDEPLPVKFLLQIDKWSGLAEQASPLFGIPIASGMQQSAPKDSDILGLGDLDYLLLSVRDDPGGPALLVSEGSPMAEGMLLTLVQHYAGGAFGDQGKAFSQGSKCRILERQGSSKSKDPELCPAGIQHGCSSDEGASGGALVGRSSLNLAALHISAGLPGEFNCGIPTATIIRDLCRRHGETVRGVLGCVDQSRRQ